MAHQIAKLLLEHGSVIRAVLNDSDVRIRDRPATRGSRVLGNLNAGDTVVILARSPTDEAIGNMTAPWYRIKDPRGTVGYSYGFFFDADGWEIAAAPTFFENDAYGFGLDFPATWDGWRYHEALVDFGYDVTAPVFYFGLPRQEEIFAVGVYMHAAWDVLVRVGPPDGVADPPAAKNRAYRFDYSLGHYAADKQMQKRRGEVPGIMKTLRVTEPAR